MSGEPLRFPTGSFFVFFYIIDRFNRRPAFVRDIRTRVPRWPPPSGRQYKERSRAILFFFHFHPPFVTEHVDHRFFGYDHRFFSYGNMCSIDFARWSRVNTPLAYCWAPAEQYSSQRRPPAQKPPVVGQIPRTHRTQFTVRHIIVH